MTGFPGSLGGRGLTAPPAPAPPASRGLLGGFPPSGKGLDGLDCSPEGIEGLEAFFMGGLSLRGGGMASCFSGMLGKEKGSYRYTDSNGRHVIVASSGATDEKSHGSDWITVLSHGLDQFRIRKNRKKDKNSTCHLLI